MLAVGGMLTEAARQRFIHVKLGTHEVGSTHADGRTATTATGQRMLVLLLLAVAHNGGPWQGGGIWTQGMLLLKRQGVAVVREAVHATAEQATGGIGGAVLHALGQRTQLHRALARGGQAGKLERAGFA